MQENTHSSTPTALRGWFDWRNWSLFWKLVSAITTLIIFFTILLTVISIERERNGFRSELESQAQTFLGIIAASSVDQLYFLDVDGLTSTSLRVLEQEEVLSLHIYDDNGRLLVSFGDNQRARSLGADSAGQALLNRNVTLFEWQADRLVAGQPITVANTTLGAAQIELSTRRLDERVADLQQQGLSVSGLAVLIGVLVAALISRTIVNPVVDLAKTASSIAGGNTKARAKLHYQDEVGNLALIFNNMTEQLTQRELELKAVNASLNTQIAEAEAARREAERSDHVKTAFLASMSHELRTPLNSVINFSKFVVRGVMGPVNERQQDALDQVISNGEHLLSLINDVLDMSKIESGAMKVFVEDDIDIVEIINRAVKNAESLLDGKTVQIKTELEDEIPLISGDRKRLLQIILNIVSNACKFTNEGYILVKAAHTEGHIHISVTDTGPGIAPEDYDNIFDPFKQGQSGLSKGEGTGLGLPISKTLAEAHGGRLWFESDLGNGTTFFVTLPLKANTADLPSAQ